MLVYRSGHVYDMTRACIVCLYRATPTSKSAHRQRMPYPTKYRWQCARTVLVSADSLRHLSSSSSQQIAVAVRLFSFFWQFSLSLFLFTERGSNTGIGHWSWALFIHVLSCVLFGCARHLQPNPLLFYCANSYITLHCFYVSQCVPEILLYSCVTKSCSLGEIGNYQIQVSKLYSTKCCLGYNLCFETADLNCDPPCECLSVLYPTSPFGMWMSTLTRSVHHILDWPLPAQWSFTTITW